MSKVTAALALVLMASAASASLRVILQDGRPSECDADTGKWEPNSINCDFDCNSQGWEVDCETNDENFIECKVDQDGAPASEDVEFTCPFTTGQAPIVDNCVRSTVRAVIGKWNPNNDVGA